MAAVNHDIRRQARFDQSRFRRDDTVGIVVRSIAATAQHQVCIGVAAGVHDRYLAARIDAEKTVWACDRLQGIECHLQTTVRAVFETNRRAETGSQFPVRLGFGRARTDRRPADQVLQVLWCNRVQRLGRQAKIEIGDIEHQPARNGEPLSDFEGVVKMRVVDETFPAHGGTWLFEIGAHHQQQAVVDFLCQFGKTFRVVHGRLRVVDRAGPNHHQQARVLAPQYGFDGLARTLHFCTDCRCHRQLLF